MSDSDPTTHSPQTPPPAAAASPLSADRLSQAFANLMGEQPAGDVVPPDPGTVAAAEDIDREGPTDAATILESILFVGHPQNQPLSSRLIAGYLRGVSPAEIDSLAEQLNSRYREQGAPYEIISDGPGYRMTLRPEWNRLREKFYGRIREARLSQSAIDLLAIVAYRQPLTLQAIDRLRGRPSAAAVNQLVRRQLLRVEPTSDRPRVKQYRTTDRFLELFRLDSLEDLPSPEEFDRG